MLFKDPTLEGTARYLTEVVGKVREGRRFESLLNQPQEPRLGVALGTSKCNSTPDQNTEVLRFAQDDGE